MGEETQVSHVFLGGVVCAVVVAAPVRPITHRW